MSLRFAVRGAAALAVLALGVASPGTARALEVAGRCSVKFFGTSTLHDFEGSAPCELLAIDSPDASGRYGARAEVAIARMDTGISGRDKKMREMFHAKKFPRIVATFAGVDPAALRGQNGGALPFRIAIHGVEREVKPTLSGFGEVAGESARFDAKFDLSLADFGLEAPVALGFIRVDDKVKVEVHVELSAKSAPPVAPAAGH